ALDVLEARADPLDRFRLLALDPLEQLPLAAAHPLVELVQGATALGRVRLDLGAGRGERLLERLVVLGAQPREPAALALALGREPLRVGREPQLDLRQE